jgi:outer membrane protein OmpA-like peptidoglycan-associated protein
MTRRPTFLSALLPAAALLAVGPALPARAQPLPLPPAPPGAEETSPTPAPSLPLPPEPPGTGAMPQTLAGPAIDPLAIPLTPPPAPVLPPAPVVPVRPERPPPPATVAADAPGAATPIQGGLQVTFGPGRAELNPKTYAALQSMLTAAKPDSDFSVRAYAAGDPNDPSVARRLSLSRALAVRSVLIHGGVASPRITVLALGAAPPGAAPDRVDITQTQPK